MLTTLEWEEFDRRVQRLSRMLSGLLRMPAG